MKEPVVSIIIATFNADKTIGRALLSVENQSFQEWECIVVDGFSQDNTMDIVRGYASQNERIRFLSEKDKGIYDAFNKGWRIAKGEWIYYLGSDDWLTKNSFTQLFANNASYDPRIAIVSGNVIRITRSGRKRVVVSDGFKGSHQGMITRRSVIEELEGFNEDYKFLADAELKFRIKQKGYGVVNVDTEIANISSGGASDKWSNQIEMAKERKQFYSLDRSIKHPNLTILSKLVFSVLSIVYSKIIKRINL